MDAEVYSFITSLHASKYRCVLLITGAGSKALSWQNHLLGRSCREHSELLIQDKILITLKGVAVTALGTLKGV